jgi:predicted DNA-binding protein
MSKPLKKTETLEIRLPFTTKAAFMAKCRRDGSTASTALRSLIERHLEDRDDDVVAPSTATHRPGLRHLMSAALIAAGVGAVALPALARPVCAMGARAWSSSSAPDSAARMSREQEVRARFARMDANGDGVVSFEEFRQSQKAGVVGASEP